MEDENWLGDTFKHLNESEEELNATRYIDEWMSSEVCDTICSDARDGCDESKKFIDDLCLMVDSATFHMSQEEKDHARIDKELTVVIKHIDSVSEE